MPAYAIYVWILYAFINAYGNNKINNKVLIKLTIK